MSYYYMALHTIICIILEDKRLVDFEILDSSLKCTTRVGTQR